MPLPEIFEPVLPSTEPVLAMPRPAVEPSLPGLSRMWRTPILVREPALPNGVGMRPVPRAAFEPSLSPWITLPPPIPELSVPGTVTSPFDGGSDDYILTNIGVWDLVTISAPPGNDVGIQLRDASTLELLDASNNFGAGGTETITFRVEAGRTYLARITGGGTYTLDASVIRAEDPNYTIGSNASATRSLSQATPLVNSKPTHIYALTGTFVSGIVTVTLTPGFDGILRIKDQTGALVDQADQFGNGGTETLQFTVAQGTTYTVEVAAFSGFGSYTLTTAMPALLDHVGLGESTLSLTVGDTHQMAVTAFWSDGTTTVVTSLATYQVTSQGSGGPGSVSVSSSGLITGLQATSTAIVRATYQGQYASLPTTILAPTLQSITLDTTRVDLLTGGAYQLVVTAHWSNGTTADVTSNTSFEVTNQGSGGAGSTSVSAGGLITALQVTTAALVQATYQGQVDSTSVYVTPASTAIIRTHPTAADSRVYPRIPELRTEPTYPEA